MNHSDFKAIQPAVTVNRKNRPKSQKRNTHGGAFVDPFFVAPRLKNARRIDNPFEHLAVGAATDGVGGDEAGGLQFAGCDLGAGFFEPVGDEVGATGDAAFEALFAALEPGAEEAEAAAAAVDAMVRRGAIESFRTCVVGGKLVTVVVQPLSPWQTVSWMLSPLCVPARQAA